METSGQTGVAVGRPRHSGGQTGVAVGRPRHSGGQTGVAVGRPRHSGESAAGRGSPDRAPRPTEGLLILWRPPVKRVSRSGDHDTAEVKRVSRSGDHDTAEVKRVSRSGDHDTAEVKRVSRSEDRDTAEVGRLPNGGVMAAPQSVQDQAQEAASLSRTRRLHPAPAAARSR